ncbi:MAG TPA: LamG-like jellyroll fold domain-containing protein, partial [Terracidiphilus sp.]|nr:LamG-like jellyroll fold domain-containing protein [Terracidiphilus sp.]
MKNKISTILAGLAFALSAACVFAGVPYVDVNTYSSGILALSNNVASKMLANSNAAGLMGTNYVSRAAVVPRMAKVANRTIPMGWAANGPSTTGSQAYVLGIAQGQNANQWATLGWKYMVLNCGTFSTNRDGGGNLQFNSTFYPLGMAGMASALASNNCVLGVWDNLSTNATTAECGGSANITPGTAYQDGYALGLAGVRELWVGAVALASMDQTRYSFELLRAGLDDGCAVSGNSPVHLAVSGSGLLDANGRPPAWAPGIINSIYLHVGADLVNLTFSQLQAAYDDALLNNTWVSDNVCTRTLLGLLHGATEPWQNADTLRFQYGLTCLAPMPAFTIAPTLSYETPILQNSDAIAILQDAAGMPAVLIQSNATSQVWYRQLSGGDVAVGLWNLSTNSATTISQTLASIPGFSASQASVVDVFDRLITSATNTISAAVNASGLNLYRLKPATPTSGATVKFLDVAGNAWSFSNGKLTGVGPYLPINTNNLVGRWDFNDSYGWTALDASPYHNSASANTSPIWTNSAGIPAAYFNGSQFFRTLSAPVLNVSNSTTISAWLTLSNTTGNLEIVSAGDLNNTAGQQLYIGGGGSYVCTFINGVFHASTSQISAGTRVHVVSVCGGTTNGLYINGVLDKVNSGITLPAAWTGPVTIGANG